MPNELGELLYSALCPQCNLSMNIRTASALRDHGRWTYRHDCGKLWWLDDDGNILNQPLQ